MRTRYKLLAVYVVGAALTYGGDLADFQFRYPDQSRCRRDIANAVFSALIPLAWPATFFGSGFYEHGFQWTCASN